jgi:hypothetical protein
MTPFIQGFQSELTKLGFSREKALQLMKEMAQEAVSTVPRRKTPTIRADVGIPRGKGHLVANLAEPYVPVAESMPYGTVAGFPTPPPQSPTVAEFVRMPTSVPRETPTLGYSRSEDIPSERIYKYLARAEKEKKRALELGGLP